MEALAAWLAAMPGRTALPFAVAPEHLYGVGELYRGFDPASPESLAEAFDTRIWRWTRAPGTAAPRLLTPAEAMAARLHDTAMDRAVAAFLDPKRWVTVGFMGGHQVSRADPAFAAVAGIARKLRGEGLMVVTGGGPGLMEAANFGAFMAPFDDNAFARGLRTLAAAPAYGEHPASAERVDWLAAAAGVRAAVLGRWDARAPPEARNLGIPTWYYGAEPPNLFATDVGKYFFNSLREDGLVSVANGGIVFGKGEAGTVQEIFQSANLNYYRGPGVEATPMVFYGGVFWEAAEASDPLAKPVFPLAQALARGAFSPFDELLLRTDDAGEAAAFIARANARKLSRVRLADLRLCAP
jgi:predicted Rossmann-fold nucleotide-binding protein